MTPDTRATLQCISNDDIIEYLRDDGFAVIHPHDCISEINEEFDRIGQATVERWSDANDKCIGDFADEEIISYLRGEDYIVINNFEASDYSQSIFEMDTEEVQKLYDAILASHHRAHLKDGR